MCVCTCMRLHLSLWNFLNMSHHPICMYLEKHLKDKPVANGGIKIGNEEHATQSKSYPVKGKALKKKKIIRVSIFGDKSKWQNIKGKCHLWHAYSWNSYWQKGAWRGPLTDVHENIAALTQNERKGKRCRESRGREMGQVKLKSKRLSTLPQCLVTM